MRAAASLAAALALPFLASFAPPFFHGSELAPAETRLFAAPVPLDAGAPGRRHLGELVFLGGWTLRAPDPRFGGLSAIHVAGDEALALTDHGYLVRFPLPPHRGPAEGRAEIRALAAGPGHAFSKRDRDSESLIVDGAGLWVGFEGHNQIWRYRPQDLAPAGKTAPRAMAGWPVNGGPETMVRLQDGRTLVLSERVDGNGLSEALFFTGDPARGVVAERRFYRPPTGHRPTDAAQAPDGRVLILNRKVSLLDGFTARIVATRIGEEGVIEGREIAAFAPPVVSDNFEALAATQENGRQILWLASDDNFNPLQRTYLLKFALARD